MKLILTFLLGIACTIAAVAQVSPSIFQPSKPELPASLRTLDGKEFSGVTLRGVTPDSVQIMHDAGTASIAFTNLPEVLRGKLGYDPEKAAEFARQTAAKAAQDSRAAKAVQIAKAREAASQPMDFLVDSVVTGGAIVRPMVMVSDVIHSSLSRVGLGAAAISHRTVAGDKVVFLQGLRNVTDDQRCTVLAYRDGIWSEEGRSLEQWVLVRVVEKK